MNIMAEKLKIDCLIVGPIKTNCFIVRDGEDGREAVLVDPGDEPVRIIAHLESCGAKPVLILLTHGHYDHTMAVNELVEHYPGLPVWISEAEKPMVEDPSLNSGFAAAYFIHPDHYFTDGETFEVLGRRWEVILSPGHTAGSACFYLPEEKILFSGDTIFRASYGRYDLPTGSRTEIKKSLVKVLTPLTDDVVILTGHSLMTDARFERKMWDIV